MKIIDSIRALLAFPEEMRGILGEIHRLLLELSSRSHNMYKNLDELSLRSHDMYQNIVRLIKWQEEWGEHFKSISYSMQANDVDYNYIERGGGGCPRLLPCANHRSPCILYPCGKA